MKIKLLVCFLFMCSLCIGQVGIGTNAPNGALDINSSTQGIVPPRVILTSSIVAAPVVNPTGAALIPGTFVWNTMANGVSPNDVAEGLYYWNGARWVAFAGSPGGFDWSLKGNSGTNDGTDFLGTTDTEPLVIKVNSTERMRMGTTETVVNEDAVNYDFRVEGTGETEMFFVDASTNHVHIRAASPFPTVDMFSSVSVADDFPINGYASGTGWGLYGQNDETTNGGFGAVGISFDTSSGGGTAGIANGTTVVSSVAGFATGVIGNGADIGVYGQSSNTTGERYGGYFVGGDITTSTTPLALLAGENANGTFGGYFDGNQDNNNGGGGGNSGEDYAYVGARIGGTTYKILGTGSNSTMVNHEGEKRVLFSPEAPEILFQDFGIGTLVDGEAYIIIDDILKNNIFVDEKHPLKVFIQLEGDCNGVFVTDKTSNGFRVKELQGGNSNISFSWQLVANRADTMLNGEVFSKHVDVRFPVGPNKIKHKALKHTTKGKK